MPKVKVQNSPIFREKNMDLAGKKTEGLGCLKLIAAVFHELGVMDRMGGFATRN